MNFKFHTIKPGALRRLLTPSGKIIILLALPAMLAGCRHKDLSDELFLNSRINVVFDWRNAPDADPSAMGFYLYDGHGTNPLRFIFQNKTGGTIRVPSGTYHSLCLNADLNDWAVFDGEDDINGYAISTTDATDLTLLSLPTRAIPRAEGAESERMARTPGMLWADRVNDIYLPASYEDKTITLYPEEKVCHYTVDIYDSGDVSLFNGGIDATLSGMAEAYNIGTDTPTEVTVTHPFRLTPDLAEKSLHAEFLTFGETSGQPAHSISMYILTADGTYWHGTVDVSAQVHRAPDPRHVHIIIRGLDLPHPGDHSSPMIVVPDVEDWQSVNITLHM